MKICGISDMHGQLSFNIEPCDLLLICGDIVPLNIQVNSSKSKKWLREDFKQWCEAQPCKKVMFIGGNHDFYICEHENGIKDMFRNNDKISYLSCSSEEFEGFKIYGSPWSKTFGNWWFMDSENNLENRFNLDMDNIKGSDIIIAHDAPYGVSDVLLQEDCPWTNGEHIGTMAYTHLIERVQPKVFLHGHLHSTNHENEMLGDTEVYNTSLLNENYKLVYSPLYLDVNKN